MAFVNEELQILYLLHLHIPNLQTHALLPLILFVCPTIKVAHEPPRLEITNLRLIA